MRPKLTFTGCSIPPSKLHTIAAMMTAIGPLGHAVAIHKAEVIATASAERTPVRAASTGSDQRPRPAYRPSTGAPLSKAASALRSRTAASARSRISAPQTSRRTTAPFAGGVSGELRSNVSRLAARSLGSPRTKAGGCSIPPLRGEIVPQHRRPRSRAAARAAKVGHLDYVRKLYPKQVRGP